ncbi:ABC-2 family transporter protein [Gottschalkia purinilytica]|uniref:ABC-2 family transporter protein n=1 Tax=Gottschalkia purinilytica TaxID=1503 RepID=A0A0L0WAP9_GOTPU|nr:ABC transporter permease subunit [Gottschalkia purinilytica]KNF08405.1 ABC-2 family transporter protein [Gottschalkia purinilytica]
MNIRKYEFKKAMTSPVIIGLMLVFIFFNVFIIFENRYFSDELKVLNKVVDKFGYKINNEMTTNLKKYYTDGLNKMNQITNQKVSKTYENVSSFFEEGMTESQYGHKEDIYSQEDMRFIQELNIVESYYYMINDIDNSYAQIDLMKKAEDEIEKYNLSGEAANTVRNEYKKFTKRFDELVKNEEHKNLFFMGPIYRMHSLLFKTLFKSFIFEIIILGVIITSYLTNYEFDNNTHLLTYSTKRGRSLIKDKLYMSMFVNIIVATIIIVTGLMAYFIMFDYSGLWNVPISSYFNIEFKFPYMSWWNMSFIQYLFCGIGLIYICTLIFTGITFVISKFIKNSYIAFFIFFIVFGTLLSIPSMLATDSNTIFMGSFTPFILIINSSQWFMESGAFSTFKYYEAITVGTWSVSLIILSSLCIKRFKKQDIY